MQSTRRTALTWFFTLALAGSAAARAADACIDFKWDVSRERALFGGAPAELISGKDAKTAPNIVPNRLYRLRLSPQDGVAFPVSSGKTAADAGAFAGLAMLKIPAGGDYRIALDLPIWIDVVSGGTRVAAKDYEGQHNCAAPHKIVEFDLAGAQAFLLQFSNGRSDTLLVTVTAAPARKL